MRTWRVGTVSMGGALLALGICLLLANFVSLKVSTILISWWPVLFIILGIEILVYLYFARKEKPFIKYDFLSIIFIGVLGTMGLGAALLSSVGFLDQVQAVVQREEKTVNLPGFQEKVGKDVKRIVVHSSAPLTVESTKDKEVTIFGTYRMTAAPNDEHLLKEEDYLLVKQSGDTLYITLKELPKSIGLFNDSFHRETTILIPKDIYLEVENSGHDIHIKPRKLQQNWSVREAHHVTVQVPKEGDLAVQVHKVNELQAESSKWKLKENEEGKQTGSLVIGKGTYNLNIADTYSISEVQSY